MKKLLLPLLIVLLSGLAAQADVTINSTNFPDANFRSFLLSLYPSGYITTAQLNSRTRLDVSRQYISSLQGIKYFTALTSLDCSDNNLSWLNLNSNTQLEDLDCSGNGMTSLDISNCSNLVYLYCANNSYTTLYINDLKRLCKSMYRTVNHYTHLTAIGLAQTVLLILHLMSLVVQL